MTSFSALNPDFTAIGESTRRRFADPNSFCKLGGGQYTMQDRPALNGSFE